MNEKWQLWKNNCEGCQHYLIVFEKEVDYPCDIENHPDTCDILQNKLSNQSGLEMKSEDIPSLKETKKFQRLFEFYSNVIFKGDDRWKTEISDEAESFFGWLITLTDEGRELKEKISVAQQEVENNRKEFDELLKIK